MSWSEWISAAAAIVGMLTGLVAMYLSLENRRQQRTLAQQVELLTRPPAEQAKLLDQLLAADRMILARTGQREVFRFSAADQDAWVHHPGFLGGRLDIERHYLDALEAAGYVEFSRERSKYVGTFSLTAKGLAYQPRIT
jgi:CHASE1-domain containing sensor protein